MFDGSKIQAEKAIRIPIRSGYAANIDGHGKRHGFYICIFPILDFSNGIKFSPWAIICHTGTYNRTNATPAFVWFILWEGA